MEAKSHQESNGSLQDELLKNQCSEILPSEAIAEKENPDAEHEAPGDIGMVLREEGEGLSRKRSERPDGQENTDSVASFLKKEKRANSSIDDSVFESQEDDNIDLNLNLAAFDCDDDGQRHALDLNFHPFVHNPEASFYIEGLDYDDYGRQHWESGMPIMEEDNVHGNFHAGFTRDTALDSELRIGFFSVKDPAPDLSLKL